MDSCSDGNLYLCLVLCDGCGAVIRSDLKVMTAGVLCWLRDELQLTTQFIILRNLQLRLQQNEKI